MKRTYVSLANDTNVLQPEPAHLLMQELCEPGVGADIAQLVCTHGLVSLTSDAETGETWWQMQYVSRYWKGVFDRAWPGVERELGELVASMQTAYDKWTGVYSFNLPARLKAFAPRAADYSECFSMYLYRPVFLKFVVRRYPATAPRPEVLIMLERIKNEWPNRSICGELLDEPSERIGTLAEHHPLPLLLRIFSTSVRCATHTIETLLYTMEMPTREAVPILLLFALLSSLKNTMHFSPPLFWDPVATLIGYDKDHGNIKPPSDVFSWVAWPKCTKKYNLRLF